MCWCPSAGRCALTLSSLTWQCAAAAADAVPVCLAALPPLAALEELRIDARVALGPGTAAVLQCQVR